MEVRRVFGGRTVRLRPEQPRSRVPALVAVRYCHRIVEAVNRGRSAVREFLAVSPMAGPSHSYTTAWLAAVWSCAMLTARAASGAEAAGRSARRRSPMAAGRRRRRIHFLVASRFRRRLLGRRPQRSRRSLDRKRNRHVRPQLSAGTGNRQLEKLRWACPGGRAVPPAGSLQGAASGDDQHPRWPGGSRRA